MPDNPELPPEPQDGGDTKESLGEKFKNMFKTKAEEEVSEEEGSSNKSSDEGDTLSKEIPLKVKKLSGDWPRQPKIPEKQNPGDAGYDFYCVNTENVNNRFVKCHTGIAIKVPEGFVGKLFARSSVYKRGMVLFNGLGIIDSGYTGEIMFVFAPMRDAYNPYSPGERIGQIIVERNYDINIEEVDELPDTVRGDGGFGST